jgi:hypothetical protein
MSIYETHIPTISSSHTSEETMFLFTFVLFWLECALHKYIKTEKLNIKNMVKYR